MGKICFGTGIGIYMTRILFLLRGWGSLSRDIFRRGGFVRGGSGFVFFFWGVLSFTLIFDISNESTIVVGGVGHSLNSSIRKVNSV